MTEKDAEPIEVYGLEEIIRGNMRPSAGYKLVNEIFVKTVDKFELGAKYSEPTWRLFSAKTEFKGKSDIVFDENNYVNPKRPHDFSVKPNLPAIMNLFARNRALVHFSIICLMNGGYAPTKVLSRVALENILCMRLFNKKPDLAKEWSANPERFRKRWNPKKIRNELFSRESNLWKAYTVFYWKLCNYTHPSSKGWSEQISEKGILWSPLFNPDYASECIGLIFFTIVQSFQQFTNSFKKWFPPKMVEEINELLAKDSQMVRRHFQVRADKIQ
jgi:hypothetical protein